MVNSRESLQHALGDTYRLERELRGGMSRVYLARETALGRTVVLKVLPPDLAAGLSTERFRREIQVAAALQHPHIVPLLSAGQAGEFLYYTMPFVEGESLRERLARLGELPVPQAMRILEQVARALSYAHRHGVVHRDIKPDNILLSDSEALVADFGIAKAIALSATEGELTAAGVALGTPLYMAPEQAAADPATDARADLYSLGVVAYEMLAGQPPFRARTAPQMLAAHALEQPVPLRDRRPSLSPAVAQVVMRLLEKRPSDRAQSAEELLSQLEAAGLQTVIGPSAAPAPVRLQTPVVRRRRRWLLAGSVAAVLAGLVAWLAIREHPVAMDRAVVGVAPFRVAGADSSLAYLREGMVDLLAAKLSGMAGLRAVDPRSLLAAWRKEAGADGDLAQPSAIELAQRLGAGRLIQGDVVGTRRQITINAAMLDASTGKPGGRVTVQGSVDSLPRLVDQVVARLLALEAGESEERLATLTSTSLPALRAYLEGQALLRRSDFSGAFDRFSRALRLDSTFALAGMGLSRAGSWLGDPIEGPGSVLAWRHRDRLPAADRAMLEVWVGGRWPAPRRIHDAIVAAERLVNLAPDNAEAWYELADNLYHYGFLVDIPDPLPRSARAFKRALALDPSFSPSLDHGTTLALSQDDTAGARQALARMLQVDSVSGLSALQRWELALVVGDSAARREALQSDSLEGTFMLAAALTRGYPLQDVEEVFRRNRALAVTAREQDWSHRFAHHAAVAGGRPSRAIPLPATMPEHGRLALLYQLARFADGDRTAGDRAGRALEALIGSPLDADSDAVAVRYTAGLAALDEGRLELAQRALSDLERMPVPTDSAWLGELPAAYALLLRAQIASQRKAAGLPALLGQLDSALLNPSYLPFTTVGNLVLSRLLEQQGNLPRALVAVRRQVYDLEPTALWVTYHREEGRLAALNGDRKGAIRAYQRYLALRSGAEPRLQAQVAQVRAELEALEQESTDR